MSDNPVRTTPLAVVMDDDMKTFCRQQAQTMGVPTASYVRRLVERERKFLDTCDKYHWLGTKASHIKWLAKTPDPILERRDAQLRKGGE